MGPPISVCPEWLISLYKPCQLGWLYVLCRRKNLLIVVNWSVDMKISQIRRSFVRVTTACFRESR